MSADNWAVCPACYSEALDEWERLGKRVDESYGKIPVEEFDILRQEYNEGVEEEDYRTFREDYEFWVPEDDGVVKFSYKGYCKVCGVGTEFKEERRFWSKEDND